MAWHDCDCLLQTPAKPSLADTLMAAAGRLSPFQDEADLRAAPEDLSSASDSGSQTHGLPNGKDFTSNCTACLFLFQSPYIHI